MKENNIKKIPGASWISVNGQAELFYVDSRHSYHTENYQIHSFIDR
jgi:hypothetical protein